VFEIFEHTADLGLRVRAADLNTLFAEAGRGLFWLMLDDLEVVQPRSSLSFDLSAPDLVDLLHDFLAELLYAFEIRKLVLCRFAVKVNDCSLHAEASGEPFDLARHAVTREIKAITYHALSVTELSEGWVAEVIVDI